MKTLFCFTSDLFNGMKACLTWRLSRTADWKRLGGDILLLPVGSLQFKNEWLLSFDALSFYFHISYDPWNPLMNRLCVEFGKTYEQAWSEI